MNLSEPLLHELDQESVSTRKALERTPFDKFDWKPHEKSLTLRVLASHIANIPGWMNVTINQDELNMDTGGFEQFAADSTESLVKHFDAKMAEAKELLGNTSDEALMESWKMIAGGNVVIDMPKIAVIRVWILNHMIHHRGQLTVYLRENDIPVPSIYGPSADESS